MSHYDSQSNDGLSVFAEDVREALGCPPDQRSTSDSELIANEMQRLPSCAGMSEPHRLWIGSHIELMTYDDKTTIASEDTIMTRWWIVVVGQVSLSTDVDGATTVDILREGDTFGFGGLDSCDGRRAVADSPHCQVASAVKDGIEVADTNGQHGVQVVEDNGEVVVVTKNHLAKHLVREVPVIVHGTPETLIERAIDPTAFGSLNCDAASPRA